MHKQFDKFVASDFSAMGEQNGRPMEIFVKRINKNCSSFFSMQNEKKKKKKTSTEINRPIKYFYGNNGFKQVVCLPSAKNI